MQVLDRGLQLRVQRTTDLLHWPARIRPRYPVRQRPVAPADSAMPDCTGLDHDDFVDPGAEIEIRFDRLGSLRCRFAEPARRLLPSRWPLTPALQKFHGA